MRRLPGNWVRRVYGAILQVNEYRDKREEFASFSLNQNRSFACRNLLIRRLIFRFLAAERVYPHRASSFFSCRAAVVLNTAESGKSWTTKGGCIWLNR